MVVEQTPQKQLRGLIAPDWDAKLVFLLGWQVEQFDRGDHGGAETGVTYSDLCQINAAGLKNRTWVMS